MMHYSPVHYSLLKEENFSANSLQTVKDLTKTSGEIRVAFVFFKSTGEYVHLTDACLLCPHSNPRVTPADSPSFTRQYRSPRPKTRISQPQSASGPITAGHRLRVQPDRAATSTNMKRSEARVSSAANIAPCACALQTAALQTALCQSLLALSSPCPMPYPPPRH